MKSINHPLAIAYLKSVQAFHLTPSNDATAAFFDAARAWTGAKCPLYADPVRVERTRCCYIDLEGVRCEDVDEFGGFCPTHDTEIHDAGGDNSPAGSAIIRRSALEGVPRG